MLCVLAPFVSSSDPNFSHPLTQENFFFSLNCPLAILMRVCPWMWVRWRVRVRVELLFAQLDTVRAQVHSVKWIADSPFATGPHPSPGISVNVCVSVFPKKCGQRGNCCIWQISFHLTLATLLVHASSSSSPSPPPPPSLPSLPPLLRAILRRPTYIRKEHAKSQSPVSSSRLRRLLVSLSLSLSLCPIEW